VAYFENDKTGCVYNYDIPGWSEPGPVEIIYEDEIPPAEAIPTKEDTSVSYFVCRKKDSLYKYINKFSDVIFKDSEGNI
jgi:hypothetical protein